MENPVDIRGITSAPCTPIHSYNLQQQRRRRATPACTAHRTPRTSGFSGTLVARCQCLGRNASPYEEAVHPLWSTGMWPDIRTNSEARADLDCGPTSLEQPSEALRAEGRLDDGAPEGSHLLRPVCHLDVLHTQRHPELLVHLSVAVMGPGATLPLASPCDKTQASKPRTQISGMQVQESRQGMSSLLPGERQYFCRSGSNLAMITSSCRAEDAACSSFHVEGEAGTPDRCPAALQHAILAQSHIHRTLRQLKGGAAHPQAFSLEDGPVVIDRAPVRQVVGLADEVQQQLLVPLKLCLSLLKVPASYTQNSGNLKREMGALGHMATPHLLGTTPRRSDTTLLPSNI